MVLQLGNWRAAQNPTLPGMAVSQSVSQSVRQSLRQSVNASSCRYVLLGSNKIMWPTFAGGAFRGILLLANGQFKGSRRRCSFRVDEGAYWVPSTTGFQSFVLQCPNYFIDLPSTFVQFGCIAYITPSMGIHAHPWAEQATTLTSLISGMRGNVAI